MKKEELVALGLSQEDAEKIAKASSEELKGYVPKSRLDEVIQERDTYKGTLSERDKQLENLKKSSGDNEELKQQIVQMQKENADAIKAKDQEIAKIRLDNAVEKALSENKAKNIKAVIANLDLENAELLEDGTVKGLSEQLDKLKSDEGTAFLFESETQTKPQMRGATPAAAGGTAPTMNEWELRLAEARKNNDNLAAITIKREAAEAGVNLL